MKKQRWYNLAYTEASINYIGPVQNGSRSELSVIKLEVGQNTGAILIKALKGQGFFGILLDLKQVVDLIPLMRNGSHSIGLANQIIDRIGISAKELDCIRIWPWKHSFECSYHSKPGDHPLDGVQFTDLKSVLQGISVFLAAKLLGGDPRLLINRELFRTPIVDAKQARF
ncbi:hypothetical protein KKC06_02250 [Patescibacteria group bacterium]|nr:hypothetical protein [Patescibacteria group bacterium]